jgi:hypothetical protein
VSQSLQGLLALGLGISSSRGMSSSGTSIRSPSCWAA